MPILGSHVSTSGGVDKAPLRAKEIPVRAIQIFAKNNNQWRAPALSLKEIDAFQENCRLAEIKVVFSHAGYLINLAAPDPSTYQNSMESMRIELERGEALGLTDVVLHPGAHKETGVTVGIHRIVESLNTLVEQTEGYQIRILLETTAGQGSSIGHRFEELAEIIDGVENKNRIGVCLDTCHIFAAGYELRTKEAYEKTWESFDRIIGLKKLFAIHLNDSKKTLGSRVDRHEHIGKGEMGEEPFRFLMRDKRFVDMPCVLETPKEDDFVKYDRMNLKTLANFAGSYSVSTFSGYGSAR